MSTKTTFKRIALVTVAALGFGVLSVAPSSAAVAGLAVATTDGTSTLTADSGTSDSRTAARIVVSGLLGAGDSVTVELVLKSAPAGGSSAMLLENLDSSTPTMTGYVVDTVTSGTSPTVANVASALNTLGTLVKTRASNTVVRISKNTSAANISHTFGMQLDSATSGRIAGTYTYTVVVKSFDANATNPAVASSQVIKDVSVVIAPAAAVATTVNVTNSFARLNATTGVTTAGVDATITSVSTASATPVGFVRVGVRNADGTSTSVAQDSVTATITGAGILKLGDVTGSSFKVAATGDQEFSVLADGRAGVATITITTNGATYSPKTVTFYAKAAKTITATVAHPTLAVGANAGAVSVAAVDANGTNWTGTAYIVASSAADALVAGSATTPVACAAYNATDGILCPITAIAAGTAKFKVIDAATVALATATSNEVTVTIFSYC